MSKNKCEWEWKKLGEVCEFNRGLTYSKKDEVEHSSNCILRSNNIDLDSNSLCLDELKYINDDFEIPTSKYVKSDCILICMSNGSKSHLGKVAYIDQHYGYAFGGFMGLLCPSSRISGKFLHKILSTPAYKEYIKSLSDGANINNLKYDDLKEFEIPVPPLAEQERIVKVLDDAFAKIDKIKTDAETNLQNAKDLFQTTLANELSITDDKIKQGWTEQKLDDICSLLCGYAFDSKGYTSNDDDMLLICGDNIVNCDFRWDTIKRWPKEKCEELKRFELKIDDIILAMDRPWVKSGLKIAKISNNEIPSLLVQRTACLRGTSKINQDYLYLSLQKPDFSIYLTGNQTGGGVPHISGKQILAFKIPVPPLSIQKQIVAKLDSLSEKVKQLESNYKQVIADCNELKKSILKKAFEGLL